MLKENFFILTGGPGVGKTSVINELVKKDYNCIEESARKIIACEMAENGDALPWKDKVKYSELMLEHSVSDFIAAGRYEKVCFFDRGIPDTYGYNVLEKLPVSAFLESAVVKYRYNPDVFIFPPWEEIYHTDGERKQGFPEAIETYHILKTVYMDLGYRVIEVPTISIEKRIEFILGRIS